MTNPEISNAADRNTDGEPVLNPKGDINKERPIQKAHEWLRAAVD